MIAKPLLETGLKELTPEEFLQFLTKAFTGKSPAKAIKSAVANPQVVDALYEELPNTTLSGLFDASAKQISNSVLREKVAKLSPPSPGKKYYVHGANAPIEKLLSFKESKGKRFTNEGYSGAGEGLYVSDSFKAGEFYSDSYAPESIKGLSKEGYAQKLQKYQPDINPENIDALYSNMVEKAEYVVDAEHLYGKNSAIQAKRNFFSRYSELASPELVEAANQLSKNKVNLWNLQKVPLEEAVHLPGGLIGHTKNLLRAQKLAEASDEAYRIALKFEDISNLPYRTKEGNRYLHILEGPGEENLKLFDRSKKYTIKEVEDLFGKKSFNKLFGGKEEFGRTYTEISGRDLLKKLEARLRPEVGSEDDVLDVVFEDSTHVGRDRATLFLKKKGFEGTSWISGSHNRNKVIFDPDKKFSIKHIINYTIPAAVGTGALVAKPKEDSL